MINEYMPEGGLLDAAENCEHTSSLAGLEYAMNSNLTLEGRACLCDSSHNLIVELGKYKGIIPRSEAAFSVCGETVKDIAVITRVGKPVCFKVCAIEKSGTDTVIRLSRRLAQKECYENYVSRLVPGDITEAKITHMEPFGAFCDIGCGIVSLLSVDCISVSRISHPNERFRVGQRIRCVVKQNELDTGRITLTMKELLGTWRENAMRFKAGETAAGIVRSIEQYGVFVELMPNLAGLAEWCPNVSAGQSAAVYIKSIIPEKMKIKLVIVDGSGQSAGIKPPEYFFEGEHITSWQYSPEECEKKIFTEF